MKTSMKIALAIVALGSAAGLLVAQDSQPQDGNRPQRPGGGMGHRPPPPIIAALDANHDGVIDADEIANASNALKTLDKNGDGKLTPDELRPPRPQGGQQGGQDGNGPEGERPPGPPPQQN
jgi:hypothetical protein